MDHFADIAFGDVDPRHEVTLSSVVSKKSSFDRTCDETAVLYEQSVDRLRTLMRKATQENVKRSQLNSNEPESPIPPSLQTLTVIEPMPIPTALQRSQAPQAPQPSTTPTSVQRAPSMLQKAASPAGSFKSSFSPRDVMQKLRRSLSNQSSNSVKRSKSNNGLPSDNDSSDDDVVIERLMALQSSKFDSKFSSRTSLPTRESLTGRRFQTREDDTFRTVDTMTSSVYPAPSSALVPDQLLAPRNQPQLDRVRSVPSVPMLGTDHLEANALPQCPSTDPLAQRHITKPTHIVAPSPRTAVSQSPFFEFLANRLKKDPPQIRESSQVKVFVATWNLGNRMPDPAELENWLPLDLQNMPDIVAVGVQECNYKLESHTASDLRAGRQGFQDVVFRMEVTPRPMNSENKDQASPPKIRKRTLSLFGTKMEKKTTKQKLVSNDKFDSMIQVHFGTNYRKVASVHLKDMRLLLLSTRDVRPFITDVEKVTKATGIGNVIGNKGALLMKLRVFQTDLCFLSCHLHPHESEKDCVARNDDIQEILRGVSSSLKHPFDVSQFYDHVFVFGDLNYRVNMSIKDHKPRSDKQQRDDVLHAIRAKDTHSLYLADQLNREIQAQRVLTGFRETPPSFLPTFKVLRGETSGYKSTRTPSYCDRILYKSLPSEEQRISQIFYSSAPNVTTSDHKPVFSLFDIQLKPTDPTLGDSDNLPSSIPVRQLVRKFQTDKCNYHLKLSGISIHDGSHAIMACSNLVFHFSGEVVNEQVATTTTEHTDRSAMSFQFIPPVAIKATQQQQLQSKHLIIGLWDKQPKSGGNLVGQCVLPLDGLVSRSDISFELKLLCYSVPVGTITGNIGLMTDRQLSGSFIQRFRKEECVV
eukprot:c3087_g1_i1.p1 GENE.c3087_g1_i1~~c3087_g1_i1.p1  ORF type:complete len:867 (+),score=153.90 c3087_g1_i1:268-2868(+)